MPTVLRVDGFRFVIYPNDHPPMNVHAVKAGTEAVFVLEPAVAVRNVYEMREKDVTSATAIILDNLALLVSAWRRIHGD